MFKIENRLFDRKIGDDLIIERLDIPEKTYVRKAFVERRGGSNNWIREHEV